MAAPVSAAKPPTGCSLVIFDPIVWMMRQPPASVPRPIAACAARTTQNGIVERLDVAGREQDAGDDPHRLLRVVGAVVQAEERGRQQLQPPEPAVDALTAASTGRSRRSPSSATSPADEADERRQDDEDDRLGPAAGDDRRRSRPWPPPRRHSRRSARATSWSAGRSTR